MDISLYSPFLLAYLRLVGGWPCEALTKASRIGVLLTPKLLLHTPRLRFEAIHPGSLLPTLA